MGCRLIRIVLVFGVLGVAVPPPAHGQLAARPDEGWIRMLDSPARIAGLRIDEVIANLRLRPGDVVADLGAGTGVFSVPLARAVGPTGRVYAVEIDQGLVDHIAARAREQGAPNVKAVLGEFSDPALPAADVDVAFLHDVLHHVQDRTTYLKNVTRYLKPDGRFAVVELDAKTGAHRHDPSLQITREQLQRWMADIGFVRVEEFPMFDDKWYVIYRRR
jgi:ubiquinone/menaquinone biosynthesis C-methylase UbiE